MSQYYMIIIIGAARSGTKLLRDTIGYHPSIDRVPFDVNYIWRIGNESMPHDELQPSQLTPKIRRRIIGSLDKYHKNGAYLIEKTVSNSLRLPFVMEVCPEAKIIFLVRDGRDVVESAYRQWLAPMDWRYIFRKFRTYPLLDAPGYALKYALYVGKRLFSHKEKRVSTWGPRYCGIDQDIRSKKLIEVCAIQWVRSVELTLNAINMVDTSQLFSIKYENFVRNPSNVLDELSDFLKISLKGIPLSGISQEKVGEGWRRLAVEDRSLVSPIIQDTLKKLGYYL